jgi:hypothetical protein
MIKSFWSSVLFASVMLAQTAYGNLIINGGFDTGDFTGWSLFTTASGTLGSPSVVSFDVTGGGASDAAQFQVGNANFTGLQEGGGISQNVTTPAGTAVAHVDIATFDPDFQGNAEGGVFSLMLDGVSVDTFTTGSIDGFGEARGALHFTGSVSAGTHTLEILMTRPFITASGTPLQYVDNVSLDVLTAAVPEPTSVALIGLAVVVMSLTRRRALH